MSQYNDLETFRFWCCKVLPLVYDDSLSYYEVLCKLTKSLNDVIEVVKSIGTIEEDLSEKIEKINDSINLTKTEIEKMTLKIDEITNNVQNNTNNIDNISANVESITNMISNINEEITSIMTDINNLKKEVDDNRKAQEAINKQNDNAFRILNETNLNLYEQIEKTSESVTTLEKLVTQLKTSQETENTNLQNEINAANARIDTLEDSVTALENIATNVSIFKGKKVTMIGENSRYASSLEATLTEKGATVENLTKDGNGLFANWTNDLKTEWSDNDILILVTAVTSKNYKISQLLSSATTLINSNVPKTVFWLSNINVGQFISGNQLVDTNMLATITRCFAVKRGFFPVCALSIPSNAGSFEITNIEMSNFLVNKMEQRDVSFNLLPYKTTLGLEAFSVYNSVFKKESQKFSVTSGRIDVTTYINGDIEFVLRFYNQSIFTVDSSTRGFYIQFSELAWDFLDYPVGEHYTCTHIVTGSTFSFTETLNVEIDPTTSNRGLRVYYNSSVNTSGYYEFRLKHNVIHS